MFMAQDIVRRLRKHASDYPNCVRHALAVIPPELEESLPWMERLSGFTIIGFVPAR